MSGIQRSREKPATPSASGSSLKPVGGRKEEILRRAAQVFYKKGYRASSLQDVADEMGFTRQALYYYFGSKQELLLEMYTQVMGVTKGALAEIVRSTLPADEKLRQIIRTHTRYVIQLQPFYSIYFKEKAELPPDKQQLCSLDEREYLRMVEQVFREGTEQGVFGTVDPKIAAVATMGLSTWVYQWYRSDGPLGPDEIAEMLYDMLAVRKCSR